MVAPHLHLLIATLLLLVHVTQATGWRGVLGRVEMRAEISQRYSATLCRITLHNPHPRADHLTLAMVLPGDAFVSSLTIETGGRNITTKVEEKRKTKGPKTAAGDARTTQGSRSRLASQETQRFKASIKVAPLDEATFYIAYEQLLQRVRGRYTHTLHLPPYSGTGVQHVQVRVKEKEAIRDLQILQEPSPPAVKQQRVDENEIILTYRRGGVVGGAGGNASNTTSSNSTTLQNNSNNNSSRELAVTRGNGGTGSNRTRDKDVLTLSYDVQRTVDGGEVQVLGRFFVHYLSPEGLPKLPAHTVFALDVSGSMSDHGKLDQLKKAIIAIIRGMPEEDSFEVLVFSTRVKSLGVYRALPEQVEEGVTKIQALQALGGTNINDALLQAVTGANTHNSTHAPARQVVFLTDGKPNIGETRPDQLRRNVREANRHQLPVFSLALGQDADVGLLRQVSADNEGFTRTIDEEEQPGEELQEFYSEIATPLLTDVDVMYRDDVVDRNSIIRQGPSNFYSGSEVVFAGQLREGVKEVHPVVAGRGKEGPLQLRVSRTYTSDQELPRDNHVERLWAYLSVQDLLDAVDIVDDRNLRVEMRARAKEIAVRYQFVTRLTTLKPEDAYGSQTHPGLKSAARHQKSKTGIHGGLLMGHDLTLLSPSAIAETLPPPLSKRIHTSSPTSVSFGDNDPHFVVQVPGMSLPFCFDIHASSGSTLSLIRDPRSGVVVNGQVTAAVGRPGNTYFTSIFISLAGVNFTITTTHVAVDCLDPHGNPTVDGVASSLWPLSKKKPGRRRHRKRREPRMKRKSHRRSGRRSRRWRGSRRRGRRASRPTRHYTEDRRRRRERRSTSTWDHGFPQGLLPFRTRQQYFWRRRMPRSDRPLSMAHPQAFHPFATGPQTMPHPLASTYTHTHAFVAAPQMMTRPQTPTHARPLPRAWTQDTSRLQYQSLHTQERHPFTATLSRHTRESPLRPVLHPQAREFIHPQAGVDFSLPRSLHGTRRGRGEDKAERSEEDRMQLYRECSKTLSWRKVSERRYGRVMVTLRNHRKLDFLLGDVDLSLVVTRSRSSHGQHFLGVYLERRALLSPNTTGIIGQFVYKTVGTIGRERPSEARTGSSSNTRVRLAVMQPGPQRTYQVSEVNAFLSSRRSLLHKTQVSCLYIKDQGRGLVAGAPRDYLRPCLAC